MLEQPKTDDPKAQQEHLAKCDALLTKIMQSRSLDERAAAARELGLLSPADETIQQTRLVLRMVRTDGAGWWCAFEGAGGTIAQYVFPDAATMQAMVSAVSALLMYPLMSETEWTARMAEIKRMKGN